MADQPTTAVKPGIKTTEFALTIVANLFTIFLAIKGAIPAETAAIIIAAVNGLYATARSILKIFDPLANIPDLPPTT